MLEILNYETLRIIWWLLLGILLIGFAIMDGFDLGVAILLPFVAKTDIERRILINSIGPVWDGNQVWLILGAGAIFAAWPLVYAVSFSGFYFAMLLVLLALILRPVGFDFRGKIENKTWRKIWDICIFISGFVPALVFGIAIGNVMQGVAFGFNEFLIMQNEIKFFALFTPFSLLCGILSVTMLTYHGAAYLGLKTEGEILKRAEKILKFFPLIAGALFIAGGFFLKIIPCYKIIEFAGTLANSNPLNKKVISDIGCWLDSYSQRSWIVFAPILAIFMQILIPFLLKFKYYATLFIASSLSVFAIIATVGLTIFPFILPSNLNPSASLTVWDASSSHLTLLVMLIATLIFMPIIILYTSFIYRVMRGKINEEKIKEDSKFLY
jgi:cytochrome d ubiquinol oxidase subunit II